MTRIADGDGGLPPSTLSNFGQFGTHVGDMGDLDGDGIPEVVVGYHLDDEGDTNAGSAMVFFLHRNGTVREFRKIHCGSGVSCTPGNNNQFGASPARLDQPEGDQGHLPRLVVGETGVDGDFSNEGRVHIMRLSPNATVLNSSTVEDGAGGLPDGTLGLGYVFGQAITSQVKDIDGDGLNDLAVGAPFASIGGSYDGGVFILFMRGNDTVRDHVVLSQAAGAGFDTVAVSISNIAESLGALPPRDPALGPVDLVVGVPNNNRILLAPLASNGSVVGTVSVIAANSGGLPVTGGVPNTGFSGEFGLPVTNAGDMDGDGIDDLLVGSRTHFYISSLSGAAYILYMNDGSMADPVKDFDRILHTSMQGGASSGD